MKRIPYIVLFVSLALCLSSQTPLNAQTSHRQQVIHMAALRIARQISLPESETDKFVNTYQAYKKEVADIMSATPVSETVSQEEAVENKILGDFEKSAQLLELRKKYYYIFRAFLQPSQIQEMYTLEKRAATGSAPVR